MQPAPPTGSGSKRPLPVIAKLLAVKCLPVLVVTPQGGEGGAAATGGAAGPAFGAGAAPSIAVSATQRLFLVRWEGTSIVTSTWEAEADLQRLPSFAGARARFLASWGRGTESLLGIDATLVGGEADQAGSNTLSLSGVSHSHSVAPLGGAVALRTPLLAEAAAAPRSRSGAASAADGYPATLTQRAGSWAELTAAAPPAARALDATASAHILARSLVNYEVGDIKAAPLGAMIPAQAPRYHQAVAPVISGAGVSYGAPAVPATPSAREPAFSPGAKQQRMGVITEEYRDSSDPNNVLLWACMTIASRLKTPQKLLCVEAALSQPVLSNWLNLRQGTSKRIIENMTAWLFTRGRGAYQAEEVLSRLVEAYALSPDSPRRRIFMDAYSKLADSRLGGVTEAVAQAVMSHQQSMVATRAVGGMEDDEEEEEGEADEGGAGDDGEDEPAEEVPAPAPPPEPKRPNRLGSKALAAISAAAAAAAAASASAAGEQDEDDKLDAEAGEEEDGSRASNEQEDEEAEDEEPSEAQPATGGDDGAKAVGSSSSSASKLKAAAAVPVEDDLVGEAGTAAAAALLPAADGPLSGCNDGAAEWRQAVSPRFVVGAALAQVATTAAARAASSPLTVPVQDPSFPSYAVTITVEDVHSLPQGVKLVPAAATWPVLLPVAAPAAAAAPAPAAVSAGTSFVTATVPGAAAAAVTPAVVASAFTAVSSLSAALQRGNKALVVVPDRASAAAAARALAGLLGEEAAVSRYADAADGASDEASAASPASPASTAVLQRIRELEWCLPGYARAAGALGNLAISGSQVLPRIRPTVVVTTAALAARDWKKGGYLTQVPWTALVSLVPAPAAPAAAAALGAMTGASTTVPHTVVALVAAEGEAAAVAGALAAPPAARATVALTAPTVELQVVKVALSAVQAAAVARATACVADLVGGADPAAALPPSALARALVAATMPCLPGAAAVATVPAGAAYDAGSASLSAAAQAGVPEGAVSIVMPKGGGSSDGAALIVSAGGSYGSCTVPLVDPYLSTVAAEGDGAATRLPLPPYYPQPGSGACMRFLRLRQVPARSSSGPAAYTVVAPTGYGAAIQALRPADEEAAPVPEEPAPERPMADAFACSPLPAAAEDTKLTHALAAETDAKVAYVRSNAPGLVVCLLPGAATYVQLALGGNVAVTDAAADADAAAATVAAALAEGKKVVVWGPGADGVAGLQAFLARTAEHMPLASAAAQMSRVVVLAASGTPEEQGLPAGTAKVALPLAASPVEPAAVPSTFAAAATGAPSRGAALLSYVTSGQCYLDPTRPGSAVNALVAPPPALLAPQSAAMVDDGDAEALAVEARVPPQPKAVYSCQGEVQLSVPPRVQTAPLESPRLRASLGAWVARYAAACRLRAALVDAAAAAAAEALQGEALGLYEPGLLLGLASTGPAVAQLTAWKTQLRALLKTAFVSGALPGAAAQRRPTSTQGLVAWNEGRAFASLLGTLLSTHPALVARLMQAPALPSQDAKRLRGYDLAAALVAEGLQGKGPAASLLLPAPGFGSGSVGGGFPSTLGGEAPALTSSDAKATLSMQHAVDVAFSRLVLPGLLPGRDTLAPLMREGRAAVAAKGGDARAAALVAAVVAAESGAAEATASAGAASEAASESAGAAAPAATDADVHMAAPASNKGGASAASSEDEEEEGADGDEEESFVGSGLQSISVPVPLPRASCANPKRDPETGLVCLSFPGRKLMRPVKIVSRMSSLVPWVRDMHAAGVKTAFDPDAMERALEIITHKLTIPADAEPLRDAAGLLIGSTVPEACEYLIAAMEQRRPHKVDPEGATAHRQLREAHAAYGRGGDGRAAPARGAASAVSAETTTNMLRDMENSALRDTLLALGGDAALAVLADREAAALLERTSPAASASSLRPVWNNYQATGMSRAGLAVGLETLRRVAVPVGGAGASASSATGWHAVFSLARGIAAPLVRLVTEAMALFPEGSGAEPAAAAQPGLSSAPPLGDIFASQSLSGQFLRHLSQLLLPLGGTSPASGAPASKPLASLLEALAAVQSLLAWGPRQRLPARPGSPSTFRGVWTSAQAAVLTRAAQSLTALWQRAQTAALAWVLEAVAEEVTAAMDEAGAAASPVLAQTVAAAGKGAPGAPAVFGGAAAPLLLDVVAEGVAAAVEDEAAAPAPAPAAGGSPLPVVAGPVCTLCQAGGVLLPCEGLCGRSFHLSCVDLSSVEALEADMVAVKTTPDALGGEETTLVWKCTDCRAHRAVCECCGEAGPYMTAEAVRAAPGALAAAKPRAAGEAPVADVTSVVAGPTVGAVVKCAVRGCGRFYHPNCAAADDRTHVLPASVTDVPVPSPEGAAPRDVLLELGGAAVAPVAQPRCTLTLPRFRCPAHVCAECAAPGVCPSTAATEAALSACASPAAQLSSLAVSAVADAVVQAIGPARSPPASSATGSGAVTSRAAMAAAAQTQREEVTRAMVTEAAAAAAKAALPGVLLPCTTCASAVHAGTCALRLFGVPSWGSKAAVDAAWAAVRPEAAGGESDPLPGSERRMLCPCHTASSAARASSGAPAAAVAAARRRSLAASRAALGVPAMPAVTERLSWAEMIEAGLQTEAIDLPQAAAVHGAAAVAATAAANALVAAPASAGPLTVPAALAQGVPTAELLRRLAEAQATWLGQVAASASLSLGTALGHPALPMMQFQGVAPGSAPGAQPSNNLMLMTSHMNATNAALPTSGPVGIILPPGWAEPLARSRGLSMRVAAGAGAYASSKALASAAAGAGFAAPRAGAAAGVAAPPPAPMAGAAARSGAPATAAAAGATAAVASVSSSGSAGTTPATAPAPAGPPKPSLFVPKLPEPDAFVTSQHLPQLTGEQEARAKAQSKALETAEVEYLRRYPAVAKTLQTYQASVGGAGAKVPNWVRTPMSIVRMATASLLSTRARGGALDKPPRGSVAVEAGGLKCELCRRTGEEVGAGIGGSDAAPGEVTGPFLPYPILLGVVSGVQRTGWVHSMCAAYAPEVIVDDEGRFYNLVSAIKRGRTLRCKFCKVTGAVMGCAVRACNISCHLPCAVTGVPSWKYQEDRDLLCQRHAKEGPFPRTNLASEEVDEAGAAGGEEDVDDTSDEPYCYCGMPDSALDSKQTLAVSCDTCDAWYHCACVGVKDGELKNKQWVCPRCTGVAVKPLPHSAAVAAGTDWNALAASAAKATSQATAGRKRGRAEAAIDSGSEAEEPEDSDYEASASAAKKRGRPRSRKPEAKETGGIRIHLRRNRKGGYDLLSTPGFVPEDASDAEE